MRITLRNGDRINHLSGYGVINRALQPLTDSLDDLTADVHLFVSPPYSFRPAEGSLNVGLTMCERDPNSYVWPFVEQCNAMDLLLVPGPWQLEMLTKAGVTTPIVPILLGHDHAAWEAPVQTGKNNRAMILDRGRDVPESHQVVMAAGFPVVDYINSRKTKYLTGKGSGEDEPQFSPEALRKRYAEADIFVKWGREGWCFPILEAMSAGCLVITNCSHLPYLTPDNCLLFSDQEGLEETLNAVRQGTYAEYKRQAQETASGLTWEKARAQVLEEIKKAQ